MKQLPKGQFGFYSAMLGGGTPIPGGPAVTPLYLDKGPYMAENGSGGADVGHFMANLMVPDPLVWTNQDSINTVPRTQGLNLTWSGGDPSGYVSMVGTSINSGVFGGFVCIERVSAGQFTVPNVVLLALPPSGSLQGTPQGFLSVGSTISSTFTAPGLDIGTFLSTVSSAKPVAFQ
jgi:hypothetical protein